ncbi:MAG: hypothetical protein DRP09_20590 [Candidatus Thorarchaeota archaeon]|nr:MAG: hypothetical protein DRP09_20590 [Candidatus Thorarchaeota archaeon]
MGKDIIAISPEEVPCAFQLKGGTGRRITLNQWNGLSSQINALMVDKIVHPSVNTNIQHESWFVTNKNLDEEVSRSIDDLNRGWIDRGHPELHLRTIVRGELFKKAQDLQAELWPSELNQIKGFLELYLESGKGNLPKENFVKVLSSILPIDNPIRTSKESCKRSISAAALACALSTMSFSNEKNHFAIIEAWTLYASYVLAIADRNKLAHRYWLLSFQIALRAIYDSLGRLCDELMERDNLVEGNPFVDPVFYRCRITILIAMLSIYGLWRQSERGQYCEHRHDEFIKQFCIDNRDKMLLWGEYAVPQFLAFYWYFRNNDATPEPDFLIGRLIATITALRDHRSNGKLPDPYYAFEDIFLDEKMSDYSFKGYSYMLEGLVHLFVRTNWKQSMKSLWPDVTKLAFESFEVEKKWHYYLWRNERGTQLTKMPAFTQNWDDLKAQASENDGKNLPRLLKQNPILFLLFLCVCPHRVNSESIRWLDSKLFRKKD